MKLFYECNLFNEKIDNLSNFSFTQNELEFKKTKNTKLYFSKNKVSYKVTSDISNLKKNKDCLIIPVRDNIELLNFTLDNLKKFKILNNFNVIVVDDRSTIDLSSLVKNFKCCYVRVDYEKTFNFSMLNNIAAYICHKNKIENIILWNSDLWCHDEKTLTDLIDLHKKEESTISGTKLLYPEETNKHFDITENIKTYFPHKYFSFKGKVQFGNGEYVYSQGDLNPRHVKRFYNRDNYFVNSDCPSRFITGAFQIINLEWFINTGGLNPSLSKNYQDSDLCLKAIDEGKKVFYFGKDRHFYHGESVSFLKDKKNEDLHKDHLLFNKIWDLNTKFTLLFGDK